MLVRRLRKETLASSFCGLTGNYKGGACCETCKYEIPITLDEAI